MNPAQAIEQALLKHWPPQQWGECASVVAVSGGADSVALAWAVHHLAQAQVPHALQQQRIHLAHFNHHWRPSAEEDEQFVRQLAKQLGLPVHVGHAPKEKASLRRSEAEARARRYEFLTQLAGRLGARFVLTAHTADDQVETLLHNLFRGTAWAGLGGMRVRRALNPLVVLVRPLLELWHEQLVAYLQHLGQPWREDPTNRQLRWRRNRLRHEVLPLLKGIYGPKLPQRLLHLSHLAQQLYDHLAREASSVLERALSEETAQEVVLDLAPLISVPEVVLQEAFVQLWRRQGWPRGAMTRRHWRALLQMVRTNTDSCSVHLPGPVIVRKHGFRMQFTGPSNG